MLIGYHQFNFLTYLIHRASPTIITSSLRCCTNRIFSSFTAISVPVPDMRMGDFSWWKCYVQLTRVPAWVLRWTAGDSQMSSVLPFFRAQFTGFSTPSLCLWVWGWHGHLTKKTRCMSIPPPGGELLLPWGRELYRFYRGHGSSAHRWTEVVWYKRLRWRAWGEHRPVKEDPCNEDCGTDGVCNLLQAVWDSLQWLNGDAPCYWIWSVLNSLRWLRPRLIRRPQVGIPSFHQDRGSQQSSAILRPSFERSVWHLNSPHDLYLFANSQRPASCNREFLLRSE